MASQKSFISFRKKLVMAMGLFALTLSVVMATLLFSRLSAILSASEIDKGRNVATLLQRSLETADTPATAQTILDTLETVPTSSYGVLRSPSGAIVAGWPDGGVGVEFNAPVGDPTQLGDDLLEIAIPLKLRNGDDAFLFLGFSAVAIQGEITRGISMSALLTALFALGGLALSAILGSMLVRPLGELSARTSQIAESGDLSLTVDAVSNDEVGVFADNFRKVLNSQRHLLSAMGRSSTGLGEVITQLNDSGMTVTSSAVTIQSLVRDTASAIENLLSSLRGVGSNVSSLKDSAERGAASIGAMANANTQVAKNVEAMASSVQESTAAIDRMAHSIQESAGNIKELESDISGTLASVTEMGKLTTQVEKSARDATAQSSQANENATQGEEALNATLNGIDRINDATQTTFEVISSLISSTNEIGTIIGVIKSIADQTNLLALNASIIASQAGEQGRGFGVVADEIKNLAERTRLSTTEIATLIAKIQTESDRAIKAMTSGIDNVDQGVRVGRQAGEAFQKIVESTVSSGNMVQDIAIAMRNQAQQTKNLTTTMERVAQSAKAITRSSGEQATGSQEIRDGTRRMNALTTEVHRSSTEQTAGSRQVIQAIKEINEFVGQVSKAQESQTASSEEVLQAIELIHEVCYDQEASMRELDQTINSLYNQSMELSSHLDDFQV